MQFQPFGPSTVLKLRTTVGKTDICHRRMRGFWTRVEQHQENKMADYLNEQNCIGQSYESKVFRVSILDLNSSIRILYIWMDDRYTARSGC